MSSDKFPAIGSQLKNCPVIVTLGVCPNFSDYPDWKKKILADSPRIYFPTSLYAEMFVAMGKEIFPSIECYRFVGDKIRQTLLFEMLGLPVLRTRVYYGPLQRQNILHDFPLPFVGKAPRFSSQGQGVFLISTQNELEKYLKHNHPAYIQEYMPACRDFRVVLAGTKVLLAYERIPDKEEFRANVTLGARISFEDIPNGVIDLARSASELCRFNYTGLDICQSEGRYYILEANMKFGTSGFRQAGLDLKAILCELVQNRMI